MRPKFVTLLVGVNDVVQGVDDMTYTTNTTAILDSLLARPGGIRFVGGIFARSQGAGSDRTQVASDGLHPSGAQYVRWVDLIKPVVRDVLARP